MFKIKCLITISTILIISLFVFYCAGGYGKGFQIKFRKIYERGYSYKELYQASLESLKEIGEIKNADYEKGIIIAFSEPYLITVKVKRGSYWLTIKCEYKFKGKWKETERESILVITPDGKVIFEQRAGCGICSCIETTSKLINIKINSLRYK